MFKFLGNKNDDICMAGITEKRTDPGFFYALSLSALISTSPTDEPDLTDT